MKRLVFVTYVLIACLIVLSISYFTFIDVDPDQFLVSPYTNQLVDVDTTQLIASLKIKLYHTSINTSSEIFITPSCHIVNAFNSTKEHHNVALIKVHKTGSTTLASILYRYGIMRNLSFVMPTAQGLHQIHPDTLSGTKLKLYKPCHNRYNIVNIHTRFNGRANLIKTMPEDTTIIAIVRHPVLQLLSGFNYYGCEQILNRYQKSFSDFIADPIGIYNQYIKYIIYQNITCNIELLWNSMSADLGLLDFHIPLGYTRTNLENDSEAMERVNQFLAMVDKDIDLMIISEEFDVSLILLSHLLNWDIKQMSYMSLNRAKSSFTLDDISANLRRLIIDFSYIDYLLYTQSMNKLSELKLQFSGNTLLKETQLLQTYNALYSNYCLSSIHVNPKLYGAVPILDYSLSSEGSNNLCCRYLAADEWTYVRHIKKYMDRSCNL